MSKNTAEWFGCRRIISLSVNVPYLAHTVLEHRFKEVAGDRPNSFVKSGVCYIEVLFHIFYYYWGKEYRLLYGLFR